MSTIPDRAASPQSAEPAEPAEPAETTDHLLQDTHLPGSSATRTVKQMAETYWILALSCAALIFDGYDIVVYGTIVSRLLKDPSQLGSLNAAQAGTIGSYALIGVMIGALAAGAVGDHIGRRKIVLGSIAWFSIGMALTAVSMNFTYFGAMRLLTGIGLGALLATLGAVVAECAPIDKKNLFNALVYSGIPAGGVLASIIALVALPIVGWRGLFWIGALPLVILLPFAWKKIPESPKWLEAKGRHEEAQRVAERTGVALDGAPARSSSATGSTGSIESAPVAPQAVERVGFHGLFTGSYLVPTILLGFMSFSGLLLTYGLNTWLPRIMESYGFNATYSLTFLLLLNTGAVIGGLTAAYVADRWLGAKWTIVITFVLAALSLTLMTVRLPDLVLLAFIFVAGIGTLGTQVLIYGKVSNYYSTKVRAAGVAWCAGFGRLGGIFGPIIGGLVIAALAGPTATAATAFYVFAGVAVFGALVCALVPKHD